MDIQQCGLILLMKSAILQQPSALPQGFDLEQAYPNIKQHRIAPLVYLGARYCGFERQQGIMQKLFTRYCQQLKKSEEQLLSVAQIEAAFNQNGIDYLPLKGCKLKGLYPSPELRTMSDADILIREDQYDKIKPILNDLGFSYDHETDHELIWRKPQLYLELHKHLIPSYNKDFYAYFGNGWQLAKPDEGTRYCMTAEDEMVFLFTHFAKHYRDGGIGCRFALDLWLYRRAHPDLDEKYIRSKLEILHLTEFYENILRLLDVWFCDGEEDEKVAFLTDYIFASGLRGQDEQLLLSQAVKNSKNMPGKNGRLHYILQFLFPNVILLREKYTILQKAPWMLPIVWLIRPFYKILFERKSLHKRMDDLKALDQDPIDAHQKMLQYVGLDYHF